MSDHRLTSLQMAEFVSRGCLKFDAIVPEEINRDFMARMAPPERAPGEPMMLAYYRMMQGCDIPEIPAGTPLAQAYEDAHPLGRILDLPQVRGIIESLVGPGAIFDHQFLHVAFPPSAFHEGDAPQVSQAYHQDSTIDPRDDAFDIQIMYYPHAIEAEDGGTRYLPGSHLRKVSEMAIARYQNIVGQEQVVCPSGTLLVLHHGMWHGGGINRGERARYMHKVRINPSVPQVRLWDTSDLAAPEEMNRPIYWRKTQDDSSHQRFFLTHTEPWHEQDTGRLEQLLRAKLWRAITGDNRADVDYWLTRLEAPAAH